MIYLNSSSIPLSYSNGISARKEAVEINSHINSNVSAANTVLVDGDAMIQRLGRSVLGEENIAKWKEQGLEINNKTIEYAFEQMNRALNALDGKAGGISVNYYQVVDNIQATPNWFKTEQSEWLENIQDPRVKAQFQAGELYVTRHPSKYDLANMYSDIYTTTEAVQSTKTTVT